MPGALEGLLVISVEQAVAAPYCAARLADAGARVIKIERPEGDFARAYDAYVHGQSSYFVWLNRGKQSVTLDFKDKGDLALLHRMIGKADVLIQNLAPGAAEGPGRVGISATDIGTGMYAHAAVLEALLARQKTGEGRAIAVSLFSAMAEWMTVPVLAKDYSDYDWPRLGLTHPFIAPYGVYQTADKVPVLISIQNDREFERLCHGVLDKPGLEKDPDYATNKARNARRDDTNAIVQKSFSSQSFADLAARLDAAQIAWARVSSVDDLSSHPQLRRVTFGTTVGDVSMPALAASWDGEPERLGEVPTVGQHSEQVRREFAA